MQEYAYNLATDKYKGLVPGMIKFFLFVLSVIYGLLVRILIFLKNFKKHELNAKVISVGNITLGGTGKTTLVRYICRYLKREGRKVAVLTRGYKGDSSTLADEPCMLRTNLQDVEIIVDANRIKSGKSAIIRLGSDTLVLDDGFQQWNLKKDLEIVTVDAVNPFGNKHMIPRGILREPLSSLKRADIFVVTKSNLKADIRELKNNLNKINPSAEIFESVHQPVCFYNITKPQELLKLECLRGKTVVLFSGIGDPDSFLSLIKLLGINVGLALNFPDHYQYTQKDLNNIRNNLREKNIDTIITTEKDAVRLNSFRLSDFSFQLLVLRIEIALKDEQKFHNRLLKLYSV